MTYILFFETKSKNILQENHMLKLIAADSQSHSLMKIGRCHSRSDNLICRESTNTSISIKTIIFFQVAPYRTAIVSFMKGIKGKLYFSRIVIKPRFNIFQSCMYQDITKHKINPPQVFTDSVEMTLNGFQPIELHPQFLHKLFDQERNF